MKIVFPFIACATISCISPAAADDSLPFKSASEIGIKTCLAQIKEVSNHAVNNQEHASHNFWSKASADTSIYSSFVVKGYSDGDSHVSIIVGPEKSGNCFAEYNETSFWPKSCSVIREEVFSGFKFEGSLKGATVVIKNEKGSINVYLTPQNNGNGCLSTTRQVIYY